MEEERLQNLEYAVILLASAIEDGRISGVLSDVRETLGYPNSSSHEDEVK